VFRGLSGVQFALCCLTGFAICRKARSGFWLPAMAALWLCMLPVLQAAGGSARNDVMPCLLLLLGVLAAVNGLAGVQPNLTGLRAGWCWSMCGLGLALAASAKISYASAPLSGLVFLLWLRRRKGGGGGMILAAYGAGCAAGGLPIAWYLLRAPDNFIADSIVFHLTAPNDWYGRNRTLAVMLTAPYRAQLVATAVWQNAPVVAALVLCLGTRFYQATATRADKAVGSGRHIAVFLCVLLAGAVPFALLPRPTHSQYLLPVFVLVTLLGACCLPDMVAPGAGRRAVLGLVLCGGMSTGGLALVQRARQFVHPADWVTMRLRRDSLAIRAALPPGVSVRVATLSPIRVLAAGASIYPDLAAGPFFFRSGDLLAPARLGALHGASPATLTAMLDAHPPGAVFVGYEASWDVNLDGVLTAYAESRHFRKISLPGDGRLWVSPRTDCGRQHDGTAC
jgi:hypothetical protein